MKLTTTQTLDLKSVTFGIGNDVLASDGRREESGYFILEGVWSSEYRPRMAHVFKIEVPYPEDRSKRFLEEIVAASGLADVYELDVKYCVIITDALERTADRRNYTHKITMHGSGYINSKIWQSMPFEISFGASETICDMLRIILQEVMSAVDIEHFPRK